MTKKKYVYKIDYIGRDSEIDRLTPPDHENTKCHIINREFIDKSVKLLVYQTKIPNFEELYVPNGLIERLKQDVPELFIFEGRSETYTLEEQKNSFFDYLEKSFKGSNGLIIETDTLSVNMDLIINIFKKVNNSTCVIINPEDILGLHCVRGIDDAIDYFIKNLKVE